MSRRQKLNLGATGHKKEQQYYQSVQRNYFTSKAQSHTHKKEQMQIHVEQNFRFK